MLCCQPIQCRRYVSICFGSTHATYYGRLIWKRTWNFHLKWGVLAATLRRGGLQLPSNSLLFVFVSGALRVGIGGACFLVFLAYAIRVKKAVDMALRGNGLAITQNKATYIPPTLMPGYGGHVPSIKFMYGETFGNASSRYLQEYRSRSIPSGKNPAGNTMLPSIGTDAVRTPRDQAHSRAISAAYWSRCNVDVERQMALKTFGQMSLEHRARYNGLTGSSERLGSFILPGEEGDIFAQAHKSLPALTLPVSYMVKTRSGKIRRFRTVPSGLRTALDERAIRDVFS